jgi:hypothetical protein
MRHSTDIAELRRLPGQTKLMPLKGVLKRVPLRRKSPLQNQRGFGLVVALFAIVILAMFGVLAARYIFTTSISSTEDYLWAQALYAAEATAHRQILYNDGGGAGGFVAPVIQNVTSTVTDNFGGVGLPATVMVQGEINGISRIIAVKYIL